MENVALAVPIQPGKTQALRDHPQALLRHFPEKLYDVRVD